VKNPATDTLEKALLAAAKKMTGRKTSPAKMSSPTQPPT